MKARTILAAAAIGAAGLLAFAGTAEAQTTGGRPDLSSPLRAGARPGCRWVDAPAKQVRICDTKTKVCRTRTVPAQRVWACGTVRD